MKAVLYMADNEEPVAVFDNVNIVKMNDNHTREPYRIAYSSAKINACKTMVEMHRDSKMKLELEDGRTCSVLLQHASMDSQGNAVGVLRVLGGLSDE